MQIVRDLAGATADLANKSLVAHRSRETLQHLTVQRHVLQFVVETPHIFLGDQVVALACLLKLLRHTCFLLWCFQLRCMMCLNCTDSYFYFGLGPPLMMMSGFCPNDS
jgi:hypothetical protein